jgi:hypothetical protein
MLNLSSPRLSARFTPLALVALSALLLCSLAFAQVTVSNGSIAGNVTDATGAVVPNARVTMTGPTGQTIHAITNEAGTYSSGALVPGTYSVRVEAKGFKTTQLSLDVQVNNTANGNIKLEIGQESTVVEVQASQVAVNTEQAEVQGVLTASQISNLPVNGRNFLDLAQLEPGVQIQDGENFDPTKVGYSSISFGGRFGRTARINVDGVDVSDETVGTTTEDIPASGIQEFSLAQSSLDLSNDLTSSGAVNVTTKSGTNAVHGEAFGLFRDSSAGAAALPEPFLSTPLPNNPGAGHLIAAPFQRNQEGGSVGGPIIKDKLFFFLDGERTLQHQAAPILETAPFQALSGTFPAPFKENELMGRLDYSLTKTARLFGRFNYFDNNAFATFFPSSFQVYNNKDYTRNEVVGLDFNTGSFTHTVRFSHLKFQNQIVDGTRGQSFPTPQLANYPVSIEIGSFTSGPNLLAPQSTPQANRQIKYDGSKIIGKHILRFGGGWNHIQGGGFAKFFSIDPIVVGAANGPDPTQASILAATFGNGQGFSTTEPALGFPAGGLGPDNRVALYIGDSWKVRPNLTIALGLRWDRDTGRTDSDIPAIPALNAAFPGYGNRVYQPNRNFAPQFGIAWDPKSDGKTVFRAGVGLFYENVIFNNVLFDRPPREQTGAFLLFPNACLFGTQTPMAVAQGGNTGLNNGFITVNSVAGPDPNRSDGNWCNDTIANSAAVLASVQKTYQADNPFSLTAPNPNYIGTTLAAGNNQPLNMIAPNYQTPRSVQMNFGLQHEIRRGMVLSADFLRNVETRTLLGIDINHAGAARYFNLASAQNAVAATEAACGHAGDLPGTIADCSAVNGLTSTGAPIGANIGNFTAHGLGSAADTGAACPGGCAFGGINPAQGQMFMSIPVGRSVYNALQMKLIQNVANPMRGVKAANFQLSYSLSRFVNPAGFAGGVPPSNPTANNDQDFFLQAQDNDHPLKYNGPSLLDRTHQFSFGGSFDVPHGFRFGLIGHFYSPLSSVVTVGSTGTQGQIFQTDFTGSGAYSDPLPGTKNGAFGRQFGVTGLNEAISTYNATYAGNPTPAGMVLVNNNLFTPAQLQQIGAIAPTLAPAPSDQLLFPWVKALDFKLSWTHRFAERVSVEPSIGFFNIMNFANFNQPPGAMTGWLQEVGGPGINGSISTTHTNPLVGQTGPESNLFRVGDGTGVFGMGSPRVMEFGLRVNF